MPSNVLGAFVTPFTDTAKAAAQVAASASQGDFGLPPQIGAVLNAVALSQDTATANANKVQATSPTANRPAEDMPGAAAPWWRQWLSGWRLVAVLGVAAVGGWFLLGKRRRG